MIAALLHYSSHVICSRRVPPPRKMNLFSSIGLFSLLIIIHAADHAKSGCLEKEKALVLLETAENFLAKATGVYPSCKKKLNSTVEADCENEKSLAYIEISKKLISEVRENFPSCINHKVNDTKNETKHEQYGDCSETKAAGLSKNGVYTIRPKEFPANKSLKVYCDMETDGGGWTVIQRRGKYPVQRDFNLDWESYKNGFGNLEQEFWLGNENIRVLCLKGCKIRFDLLDYRGVYRYAVYQTFKLSSSYQIEITNYSGNATDAMKYHNNYEFSTKDRDVSGKAKEYNSGWWHGNEYYSNLNGIYEPGASGRQHVYWWKESNDYYNLKSAEMKVKLN